MTARTLVLGAGVVAGLVFAVVIGGAAHTSRSGQRPADAAYSDQELRARAEARELVRFERENGR